MTEGFIFVVVIGVVLIVVLFAYKPRRKRAVYNQEKNKDITIDKSAVVAANRIKACIAVDREEIPDGFKMEETEDRQESKNDMDNDMEQSVTISIRSPLTGKVIPLSQAEDPVLAGGILGEGVAILPEEGIVYAPEAGRVTGIALQQNIINFTTETGVELCIHVGIDTAELKGEYYTPHVEEGDYVTPGTCLLTFDIPNIKQEGYLITTPVIITNMPDYESVEGVGLSEIEAGEILLYVRRKIPFETNIMT